MSFKSNLSLNCAVIMFLISHVYVCEPGVSFESLSGLCEIPPPPIIVKEAFINDTLTRTICPAYYLPNTIIYMGCIEKYVAIYSGGITNTCKQNGEWSEDFVRCGM